MWEVEELGQRVLLCLVRVGLLRRMRTLSFLFMCKQVAFCLPVSPRLSPGRWLWL